MTRLRYFLKKKTITTIDYDGTRASNDYVWIPSTTEMEKLPPVIRQSHMTDFASDNKDGAYLLRDCPPKLTDFTGENEVISCKGESNTELKKRVDNTKIAVGIRPAFSIDMTQIFPHQEEEIFNTIKTVKDKNGQVLYHTIDFGEFPQSKVDDWLRDKLEDLYHKGGNIYENFEKLRNVFVTDEIQEGSDLDMVEEILCPECEYRGEKYVRKLNKENQLEWFKVEPLKCIITNWDNLPERINPNGNGTEDFIDVLTEKVINNTNIDKFINKPKEDSWLDYESHHYSTWEATRMHYYLNDKGIRGFIGSAFWDGEEKFVEIEDSAYDEEAAKYLNLNFVANERHIADNELLLATKHNKKYIHFNDDIRGAYIFRDELPTTIKNNEVVIPVDEFRKIFTKLQNTDRQAFWYSKKEYIPRIKAYVEQVKEIDMPLPLQFVAEHEQDIVPILENYQLFKEKIYDHFIKERLNDLGSGVFCDILHFAVNVGCFSNIFVRDYNNKPCLSSERGVRILENLLHKGMLTENNISYIKYSNRIFGVPLNKSWWNNKNIMNFLEKNLDEFIDIALKGGTTTFRFLFNQLNFNTENKEKMERFLTFQKRFNHFTNAIYRPFIKNENFIAVLRKHVYSTDAEIMQRICDICFHSDCFRTMNNYEINSSTYKDICNIHNKYNKRKISLEDLINDKDDNNKLMLNIAHMLKSGQFNPVLDSSFYNWTGTSNAIFRSYIIKDNKLFNSVFSYINNHFFRDTSMEDYEKIYKFAQKHQKTKMKYPMYVVQWVDEEVLDSINNDKEFSALIYNKFLAKEMDKMTVDNVRDLYKFAYSLGCFSDKKILDKKGNETKTTFAQKACNTFRILLENEKFNLYNMHDLFNNLPIISEPNQDFLDFIGKKEGNSFKNFDILKKFHRSQYGRMATIMADWDKVKEYRTILDADGTPRQQSWEDAIKTYFSKNVYANVREGYEDLAEVMSFSGAQQYQFDEAQDLFDKAKENNIPTHILNKHLIEEIQEIQEDIAEDLQETKNDLDTAYNKNFTWEMLSKKDPRNVIIGLYCGCCATITGTAYGSNIARATVTAEDVQNMVIRNKQGEIMSKGTFYVNKEQGYVVINDFEMNQNYRRHEGLSGYYTDAPDSETAKTRQEIFDTYMRGVNAFVEEYDKEHPDKPIEMVVVGRLYNRLKKQCEEYEKLTEHLTVPAEYSFEDAQDAQFVLYRREDALKNKSQTQKQEGGLTL